MTQPIIYILQGAIPQGGIYDYCIMLKEKMRLHNQNIDMRMGPSLGKGESVLLYLRKAYRVIREQKKNPCIFHFHYPGWQRLLMFFLIPQMLLVLYAGEKAKIITTIHDFTKFPKLSYIIFYPFFRFSDALIFTTEFEYKTAFRMMKALGIDISAKSTIIPVGSNIESLPNCPPNNLRHGVCYFGHIRRGKGIDFFLQTAQLLHQKGHASPFYIIGNIENWDFLIYRYAVRVIKQIYHLTHDESRRITKCKSSLEFRDIIDTLNESQKRLPNVRLLIALPAEEVSKQISQCRFALLPFPDGASMRRGSLQTVLNNKCMTITRWGPHTTELIKSITLNASSPEEAAQIIIKATSPNHFYALLDNLDDYLKKVSWDTIAASQMAIYRSLSVSEKTA